MIHLISLLKINNMSLLKKSLAAELSKLGIRVAYCWISDSISIYKTIAMSRKYDQLRVARVILDDSIEFCTHNVLNIDKKNFIDRIVSSQIGNEDFAKRMYERFIKAKSGLKEKELDKLCFPLINKEYFFLRKSARFTDSLNELMHQYYNCTLKDVELQNSILKKMDDEIKIIANDLHLSLTIEKDAMDSYYLLPLLRKEKMDKAVKGIYKTTKNQSNE